MDISTENFIDIVCIFYLLPAVLLLLYNIIQEVRAERKGVMRVVSYDFIIVSLIPVLNLCLLLMLFLMLYFKAAEYICENSERNNKRK